MRNFQKTNSGLIIAVLGSIALILTGLFTLGPFLQKSRHSEVLLDYGPLPDFRLVDASAAEFDSKALNGSPWIASFIFTRCQSQCPLMVGKLAGLSKKLPEMTFVSFTADPDYDKPEKLTEYMKSHPGPENWQFLTGDKAQVTKVAIAFKVATPDNPQIHSTRFALVDDQGHIRGYYDSEDPQQMELIIQDAKVLMRRAELRREV